MRIKLFFCLLMAALVGCQMGQGATPTPMAEATLTGKVSIIGNEPFTAVALTAQDGTVYELTGAKAEELRALQGFQVEVKGRLTGHGRYAAQALEVRIYQRLP